MLPESIFQQKHNQTNVLIFIIWSILSISHFYQIAILDSNNSVLLLFNIILILASTLMYIAFPP